MEMELKQYLFHIIEAPEASNVEDTIQPLFVFLDNQLAPYRELLIRQNLTRYDIIKMTNLSKNKCVQGASRVNNFTR